MVSKKIEKEQNSQKIEAKKDELTAKSSTKKPVKSTKKKTTSSDKKDTTKKATTKKSSTSAKKKSTAKAKKVSVDNVNDKLEKKEEKNLTQSKSKKTEQLSFDSVIDDNNKLKDISDTKENKENETENKTKITRRKRKTIIVDNESKLDDNISDKTQLDTKDSDKKDSVDNKKNDKNENKKKEVAPSVNIEDLVKLSKEDLYKKAAEFDISKDKFQGLKKDEISKIIFDVIAESQGFKKVCGILDIMQDGYGFLRCKDYMPSEFDVYLSNSLIRKNGLRKGDEVIGRTRPAKDNEKYAALNDIEQINKIPIEKFEKRPKFSDLTPIFPDERLNLEHSSKATTARVIELVAPIGKGQRGLIVSPPKAGKTTILKDIAAAISKNNPEVHLMCLLVDERPEEVTDMERSIDGEVISSTFDMPCENHTAIAELTLERAKRLVESGYDVVVLLDSITRLARAYNLAQPPSGRVLSGGVDSSALYPPKRFLGAARNIENGGSLTILASALIETGSKMDEVIFEEFKGTGNMELKLDRSLADRRIFPAIDPITSGTRKEDLLLDPQEAPLIWALRRILANLNNTERAMDMLIKSIKKTESNREFLIRTAKKTKNTI